MKKIMTKLGLTLLISTFILMNTVSLEGLYAANTPNPYDKNELSLEKVDELYNKRVNELFNSKLELLTQGEKGQGIAKIPQGDDCEEKNYTTFCLAVVTAKEFTMYREALLKRKQIIQTDTDVLTATAIAGISQRSTIDNQLNRAKKALDIALETYNECKIWPA